MTITLRLIEARDNAPLAALIRAALTEFGADRPGFAWQDPELSNLSEAYARPGLNYWVVMLGSVLVGGCGIAPLRPWVAETCELQKMYLCPSARGQGVGTLLIETALAFAGLQYHWCYLESLTTMTGAASFYRKAGFIALPQPLVITQHGACDSWYLKALE
ncbi:GNAT family N-acetyltransferase [Reinekea sp.]|jgi:putative acetyltransferase|uniref:GNAT family N-acetyltransferase n=1 Tax=Reinekea sp. TaxID=1970455 RepID=UPI002A83C282|nr:GNAT family N-acetyltransferase [Reinekea sp.]